MDDLPLYHSSPSSLLSFSHSPPPPPPSSPLQYKLQSLIQSQPHSWLYAIFWQTTHDDRARLRLSWAHGHFHGSDHHRPRHNNNNNLFKGLESLVDDNLNDAEWFYVMSLTRTFPLSPNSSAASLPAKAFSSGSPLWLNISHQDLQFHGCDRAKEASLHGIRTLICVPTSHGVLEMGSPQIIPKNSTLIQQVKSLYGSSDLITPLLTPSDNQPEQVDFLDVDETISFADIGIITDPPEVEDEKTLVNSSCGNNKSRKKDPRLPLRSYVDSEHSHSDSDGPIIEKTPPKKRGRKPGVERDTPLNHVEAERQRRRS
ncbi:hypothetical protein K1719_041239 [Acacia pycnantha]|nr:hypothetical protein K1719_041239 [Acacia pycnantha]